MTAINNNPVILFDGVCNLCNGAVQFIIRRDKLATFRFASLQSTYAGALIRHFHLQESKLQSIILYEDGQVFTRSGAALRIAAHLQGLRWMRNLHIIPRPIRDGVYDLIARSRYAVFGKRESCMIPTVELKHRFVDHEEFITAVG